MSTLDSPNDLMEEQEPPKHLKSEEKQSEDEKLSPDGSSVGRTASEGINADEDIGEPSDKDLNVLTVNKKEEKEETPKEEVHGNTEPINVLCLEKVSSSKLFCKKTEDKDDDKDNSDDDYVSDEDSNGSMSADNSESVTGAPNMLSKIIPCKRKKLIKYQRKSKKRRNTSENDSNLQPSTSTDRIRDNNNLKCLSKVKLPFRFSPKKSCSGSRFKRKLLESKRKKLNFKRRRVQFQSDTSDEERGFGINDELEEMLESNATKNNLTAFNVKSILHHVITNEHVLAMVRNTMLGEEKKEQLENNQSDGEEDGIEESQEAPFEPKMTRSKLKEVVQQVGNVPYAWPLSPVKSKKVVPQFAELNFPEDSEDDEDYHPDPNEKDESDHESYLSSQVSDFGSPSPFTPLSHHSFHDNKDDSPVKLEKKSETKPEDSKKTSASSHHHLKVTVAPMQPTSSTPQPDKINDDDSFMMLLDEMDKEIDSMSQNPLGTDNIAKRTRSKVTIENSLDEIEANFIAPDITADMYDSDCEDNEWKEWLSDLFKDKKDNELNDTFDDEQNDPDFNFMADEEEVIDTEETRTDRAVRVSKKELNVLLDELLENYGEETCWSEPLEIPGAGYQAPKTLANMLTQMRRGNPTHISIPKLPVKVIPIVTPNEHLQLQQQMQQHVQLLCQMNLLGRRDLNFKRESTLAKMFLNELAMLGGITPLEDSSDEDKPKPPVSSETLTQPQSSFIACNLKGALEIVNNFSDEKESSNEDSALKRRMKQSHSKRNSERCYNSKPVPKNAKIILMSSIVFMYPELLPHHGFKYQPSNNPSFVDSEDHLIVLGLQQFEQYNNKFRLIQKHMIPGKTVKQIQSRIKNFSAKKKSQNIIKNYKKHNIIPICVNPCQSVLPGQEVAPIFQFQDQLPDWMKNLKMSSLMKLERDLEKESKTEERTRKAVLASVDEAIDDKKPISKLKKKKVPTATLR